MAPGKGELPATHRAFIGSDSNSEDGFLHWLSISVKLCSGVLNAEATW